MPDRILFIGWGTPVRGREEHAVEVFDESIALYSRMQDEGRIAQFDVVLLEPATGLGGWVALHGTAEQLAAVREDEEFRRTIIASELIVDDLRICMGSAGEAVGREMELYRESIARVPQLH